MLFSVIILRPVPVTAALGAVMDDALFKKLDHRVAPPLEIASRGSAVMDGYKPDITIRDATNTVQYILESEQKTDRKAFLGDLVKAERYAEEVHATPQLVIVMQEFSNTTARQIADHLRPYAYWLRRLKVGNLHLSRILVMSDAEYLASIGAGEPLCSPAFNQRALEI
jgi:hypothetical protein